MRLGRAALATVAVALVLPAGAAAHATLMRAEPQTQSSSTTPPPAIVLEFNQSVTISPRAIEVFAADGRLVSGPAESADEGRIVRVALPDLPRGAYTVRWRATGPDGHTAASVFTFGVGVPAPPPTEAVGASGPGWSDDVARWAYFASLSLLLGTIGFRLLVLRRRSLTPRLSNRLYLVTAVGAAAMLNAGVVAFLLRAEDALQLPALDLLYGDLSPLATKTRFGLAFVTMTLGFALVAGLVTLAWIFELDVLLWPAFLVGLGFASGLSLSGHSSLEPNSWWLTSVADWLHLVAASLWVGGLIALALCVWPLAPELRRAAFLGFSRLAVVLVGVLVLAGTYLGVTRLAAVTELWETGYGRALLVKLALVSVALAWGAAHHFLVRPRLERGSAPAGLRRSLLGESTVAMAVLLAAAVLVNTPPPERGDEPARAAAVSD